MEKTFINEGGNILVRDARGKVGAGGVVEMLHLYDNNRAGCLIGAWKIRPVDGENRAEFCSVYNRFPTTKYSFDIMEAVKWGQKLADMIVESDPLPPQTMFFGGAGGGGGGGTGGFIPPTGGNTDAGGK